MVVAVIPARMGSTRLPGKALADVAGLPLVVHVWRRVAGSGLFDRVLVATDDGAIADAVEEGGGRAVLTGPAPSGTHRVALAAAGLGAERVVNVQGDQPLIPVQALEAVLRGLERAPISTVAAPYTGDPHQAAQVKVVVRDGLAVAFGRAPFAGEPLLHHVGIYGFRGDALAGAVAAPPTTASRALDLEQLAWLDAGWTIAVEGIASAPEGIDTPDQLSALRARFFQGLERVPDLPGPGVYAASGLR